MPDSISHPIHLAVLDDDFSILQLVGAYLRSYFGDRVDVTLLNSPEEARQFLDSHACDILLSDIEMPETDGLEMLDFAKKRNSWTQVVFMTGFSSWDRISAAIERGAADYLLKPIDRQELAHIIEGQIARSIRWKRAVLGTLRPQEV